MSSAVIFTGWRVLSSMGALPYSNWLAGLVRRWMAALYALRAAVSAPCIAGDIHRFPGQDIPARTGNILIDIAHIRIIIHNVRSAEGAVMRRHASGIGCGAHDNARRKWSAGRRSALRHWARAPRKRRVRVTGLCRSITVAVSV